MEKIMKLAALMREAQALIKEIENEKDETGISVIEAKADWLHEMPSIHMYTGMQIATNYAPCSRTFVESSNGGYWQDSTTINGVEYIEINLQEKEGAKTA